MEVLFVPWETKSCKQPKGPPIDQIKWNIVQEGK